MLICHIDYLEELHVDGFSGSSGDWHDELGHRKPSGDCLLPSRRSNGSRVDQQPRRVEGDSSDHTAGCSWYRSLWRDARDHAGESHHVRQHYKKQLKWPVIVRRTTCWEICTLATWGRSWPTRRTFRCRSGWRALWVAPSLICAPSSSTLLVRCLLFLFGSVCC